MQKSNHKTPKRSTLAKRILCSVTATLMLLGFLPVVGAAAEPESKVTFGVISDTHIGSSGQDARLNSVLDWYTNQNVDALAIVGDITNDGTAAQFNTLKACLDNHLGSGVKLVASMGNHDCGSITHGTNMTNFTNATGCAPNADYVINGYHFITLSPGTGTIDANGRPSTILLSNSSYTAAANWVKGRIEAAVAEDPTKPIFIFFHHPIRYTFYVSEEWYGSGLNGVFNNYPQVVTFSGHIHSPNNDPRSIWQDGGFTAVNTVTTYYYEMESGYVGSNANATGNSTYPVDRNDAIQGMLISVDGTAIEIKNYDFVSNMFIEQTWTFDVTQPLPYTNARAEKAQKPVFSDLDNNEVTGKIELTNMTGTGVTTTFKQAYLPQASEVGETIHSYRFDFINRETGQVVRSFKQWSDFMHEPMQPTYTQNIGGLVNGMQYELRIYGIGSFQLVSDQYLSVSFTAGEEFEIETTDKTALDDLVAEALLLDESGYTAESWAVLSGALDYAKAVGADKFSNQDEIDAAIAGLSAAISALSCAHDYAIVQTADCWNGGWNIKVCAICGETETDADGNPVTYGWTDAFSHEYETIKTVDPSCTEGGWTDVICTLCGHEDVINWSPALGHVFSAPIKTDNPLWDEVICEICGHSEYRAASQDEPTLEGVVASAYVTKLNGNKNDLTICVTESYNDGHTEQITATVSIPNNAAGIYIVGDYSIYVDTKGNDQIRECYIVG